MTLLLVPSPEHLCVGISVAPGRLCLIFPVGQELCTQLPTADVPNLAALVRAAVAQANAALMPFQPIFDVASFSLLLAEIVKSLVTGQLDDAAAKIGDLPAAISKLVKLIPQLAVPLLVNSLIDLAVAALSAVRSEIDYLVADLTSTLDGILQAQAANRILLAASLSCHRDMLLRWIDRTGAGTEPLQQLLCIISRLLALVGIDAKIPHFDAIAAATWGRVSAAIRGIEALLLSYRKLVPLPSGGQGPVVC
jgi:hypothetical protein